MSSPASSVAKLFRVLAPSALTLTIGACAVVPNIGPAPTLVAPADLATQRSFTAPEADWPAERWWEAYNDPQLGGLIDEALRGSPSLAQAQARLRRAQALAQQARASTLPTLQFDGEVAYSEISREQGFPPEFQAFLPQGYHDTGRVALNASYDLDLFGKNRAALAAAVSETAAAGADAAQTRLTLSTAVAQAYAQLAQLAAERESAAQTVANRAASIELVSQRVRNGVDTQAELQQARAAQPTAQAELDLLDERILLARHQLAALLGEGPDRGLDIALPKTEAVKAFGLPPNLAVNLVGRRPDIVAARLRAEAAGSRIKVAHAAFYPNITLNAYIGQQALGLDKLFNPTAAIGSIGPAITLPIFDGGQRAGAYRGARADYDAAVAAYDQTLVQALQDVADAAASVQASQRQLADREQALVAGEAAYSVAQLRYRGGLSTYVALLIAEDAVIAQRRAVADARTRAFLLDIALVRALGGGYAGS